MSPFPTVSLITAHDRKNLAIEKDERLIDLLKRHGIYWSAVTIYSVPRAGGAPVLSSCLDLHLSEFENDAELLIYYNRNIDPSLFSTDLFKVIDTALPTQHATEYFYQQMDNDRSRAKLYLKKLSQKECQSIVAERVGEVIRTVMPPDTPLVVGVSGGGDSNALLHALSTINDYGLKVHPIIIKGIPEWDKGVPRAQELCDRYHLDLTVMEEEEVRGLLHMPDDSPKLIALFEETFKGDDFEFLGTLLVRLALVAHARKTGTNYICTGLNLEDVLCEGMFRVSSGMKPASIPSRQIGDMNLLFPLWLCPKRIIDGCFPKFSLENYEARFPGFSLGRNLYYSVIYSIQSQFPGFAEQLARGFSDLSLKDPVAYHYDKELGFHVERHIPSSLRQRFLQMIGRRPAPASEQ